MFRGRSVAVFGVAAGLALVPALAGPAAAQEETFTLVCQTHEGSQTFTGLTKPNPNSAIFTDGTLIVSAVGASITGGTAQPRSVPCTVNGEGPFPFLIAR